MTRAPLSAWQTNTLRLTSFHDVIDPTPFETVYKDVVGQEPDNSIKRREGFQAEGMLNDGLIALSVPTMSVPKRIDWLYTTPEDGSTVGGFTETLISFKKIISSWLSKCPAVKRLALGVIVILPVADKESGYRQLAPYLPSLTIEAVGSSDLLYQINRPRDSKLSIAGLTINRLSKWQVSITNRVQFGLSGGAPQALMESSSVRCQVELDINTSPQVQGSLPSEQLIAIVDELEHLALEILQNGDTP